ncbi:MAG: restriction endonuclease subunit S [Prolixibacteraceae bacterium]|nr:restriction endonuclease subunit S [Prolixibacteraceae bacterium]
MSEWKDIVIGDIGKVITGNTPPTTNRALYGGPYPFIKPTDMEKDARYVRSWEETYSEQAFQRYKSAFIPKGATGVVTIGTVGEKLFQADRPCFTNQSVNVVVPSDDFDNDFVYYLLKYNLIKVQNANPGTASGRDHVSKSNFSSIQVTVPTDKKIQNQIGRILSTYDELIENNIRRIAILEQTAEQIYKEWFVRMRFPGYENTEFEKGVPKGWEIKKVEKIVSRKSFGKTYNQDTVFDIGKTIVIDQSKKELLGFHNNAPDHIATIEKPMIIFGDHTCKMQMIVEPFSLGENVIPLTSVNSINVYFLYYVIHSLIETTEYKRHWKELIVKKVFVPSTLLQNSFGELVKPLMELKNLLWKNNQNLIQTRDLLLPRLVSGKLKVKEAEKEIETV